MKKPLSKHTAPAHRRIRLAIVANDLTDREAMSLAFATDKKHRVVSSCPISEAANAIDKMPIDAIVGYVDNEQSWREFRTLAHHFPDHPSILLATDPDGVGAVVDGVTVNAVVRIALTKTAIEIPRVVAAAAQEFNILGAPLETIESAEKRLLESLTNREREILALTANGQTLNEIAGTINRAYSTVASHRIKIMEKLGLHDKIALTRFAIRVGLITA